MSHLNSNDNTRELIEILQTVYSASFFRGTTGNLFMAIKDRGRHQTFAIHSSFFRSSLHALVRKHGKKASKPFMEQLAEEIASLALTSGETRKVFIRVGVHESRIVLDLCDDDFKVIIIDANGYYISQETPVHFIRTAKQMPLPYPTKTDVAKFVSMFKALCNFKRSDDWILALAAVLKYINCDNGSFPILVFEGRQGSGKSFLTKCLKHLIDPTEPALASPPKTVDDIIVLANSGYVLAFDNLSGMSGEMADIFCRVATGGSISKRALYTDDSEKIYNLHRPTILNGIDEPSDRPDLVERCIMIELQPLEPSTRKTETALEKAFQQQYPELLGGLLELFSRCLKILPRVQSNGLPRMTDFARMGIALEKVIGLDEGMFLNVYNTSLEQQAESAFWDNQLCCSIYATLFAPRASSHQLLGTSSELLSKLFRRPHGDPRSNVPRSPRAFSAQLTRVEPLLNQKGIFVERLNRTGPRREIRIFVLNPPEDVDIDFADLL